MKHKIVAIKEVWFYGSPLFLKIMNEWYLHHKGRN